MKWRFDYTWTDGEKYLAWTERVLRKKRTQKLSALAGGAMLREIIYLSPRYAKLLRSACTPAPSGLGTTLLERAVLYLEGVVLEQSEPLIRLKEWPTLFFAATKVDWVVDCGDEVTVDTLVVGAHGKMLVVLLDEFPADEVFWVDYQLAAAALKWCTEQPEGKK